MSEDHELVNVAEVVLSGMVSILMNVLEIRRRLPSQGTGRERAFMQAELYSHLEPHDCIIREFEGLEFSCESRRNVQVVAN